MLKLKLYNGKVNCIVTVTETTKIYLQMECIPEILTKEEKHVDQENLVTAFIILPGFPTLMSLSKPKRNKTNTKAQNEYFCQPIFTEMITFSGAWQGSPGSLTPSLPYPGPACAHMRSLRNT